MTQEQLDEQTLKAFQAWRKDNSIPIEFQNTLNPVWKTMMTSPNWVQGTNYRIKQEEKTIAVWQELQWSDSFGFIYMFVPYGNNCVVPMSRGPDEAKWSLRPRCILPVKNTEKITADEVISFVNLNDSRCKIGSKI